MLLAALSRRYIAALYQLDFPKDCRLLHCCHSAKGGERSSQQTLHHYTSRNWALTDVKGCKKHYLQVLLSKFKIHRGFEEQSPTHRADLTCCMCIPAGKGEATKATAPAPASPSLLFGFNHLLLRFSHSGYNYLLWKVLFTSVINLTASFVYGIQE